MVKYLSFYLDEKLYMINVSSVDSVSSRNSSEITSIPNSPSYFLGVTKLREKTISVIDGASFIEKKAPDKKEDYFLIMVNYHDDIVAFSVDEIGKMKEIDENKIQRNEFIMNMNKIIDGIYVEDEIYSILSIEMFNLGEIHETRNNK